MKMKCRLLLKKVIANCDEKNLKNSSSTKRDSRVCGRGSTECHYASVILSRTQLINMLIFEHCSMIYARMRTMSPVVKFSYLFSLCFFNSVSEIRLLLFTVFRYNHFSSTIYNLYSE